MPTWHVMLPHPGGGEARRPGLNLVPTLWREEHDAGGETHQGSLHGERVPPQREIRNFYQNRGKQCKGGKEHRHPLNS